MFAYKETAIQPSCDSLIRVDRRIPAAKRHAVRCSMGALEGFLRRISLTPVRLQREMRVGHTLNLQRSLCRRELVAWANFNPSR
jgi:hypothetical protein